MNPTPITDTPTRTCLECGDQQLVTDFPFVGRAHGKRCPRRDVCRRCTRAANVKRYNDAVAEGRRVAPQRMKENDDQDWKPKDRDLIEIAAMEIAIKDGGEYTPKEWDVFCDDITRNEKQRPGSTGLMERIER